MKNSKRVDIVKICMVKESSCKYANRIIESKEQAGELARSIIGDSDREQFGVICLDTKGQPTNISIVAVGDLNCTIIHPREVFKIAILSNSSSIILFHNHPSGKELPSKEDKNVTKRLYEAGLILGVKVIDHIILGDKSTYSFRGSDLLEG